jgi:hypothetical protein
MNEKDKLERRAFNEALRERMRSVAEARGIPADRMKWLGRLKHEDLQSFVKRQKLDWSWVLEGNPAGAPVLIRRPALRIIQGGRQ